MQRKMSAKLSFGTRGVIDIPLETEGARQVATLLIDGMLYHFERVKKDTLLREYRVDTDPDYEPVSDPDGYWYMLAPYCK